MAAGKPAAIDGYTFVFEDFVEHGDMTSPELSVGVDLGVLSKKVTIDVSRKPLIGLLWLGTILMMLGGSLAAVGIGAGGLEGRD